jgi:hypothetical protein
MKIHSTFMVFMCNFNFSDYWVHIIASFVMLLRLIIVIICLRITHIYPSSMNVPISAHLMIIKILVDKIYHNYYFYRNHKPFSLQFQYFSNKRIFISLCLFVICVLNGDVAYASDDPGFTC